MVTIIPAVDIYGGRSVRLRQGDPDRPTFVRDDPVALGMEYVAAGAQRLHVIDLTAALAAPAGESQGLAVLRAITDGCDVPVQYGGGLRSLAALAEAVAAGARWVITGTAALAEPGFLAAAAREFGERLILAIDLRAGRPLVRGWREEGPLSVEELLRRAEQAGVRQVIVTDAGADGTLQGLRLEVFNPFLDRGISVIAAGGAAGVVDITALAGWGAGRGLTGIVVGSALLTGEFTLAEAQSAARAAAGACHAAGGEGADR